MFHLIDFTERNKSANLMLEVEEHPIFIKNKPQDGYLLGR